MAEKAIRVIKVGGVDVEVDDNTKKATLKGVKDFFQANGGRKVEAPEIMACKKNKETGEARPDWDEIAEALYKGELTYPDISPERKAALQNV